MKRHLLIIPFGLLVLLAGYSFVGQVAFFRDATTRQDWEAAAASVVESLSEQDAILIAPLWRETPLPPLVERSSQLLWIEAPLREDLQGKRKLWLICDSSHCDDAVVHARASLRATNASPPRAFGGVLVHELSLPEELEFTTTLSRVLGDAKVSKRDGSSERACKRWDDKTHTWRCPGKTEPRSVTRGLYEVADMPRECIALIPSQSPEVSVIEFQDVKLTNTLRTRATWALVGARQRTHEPALFRVYVDGELLVKTSTPGMETDWSPTDASTSKWADGEGHHVRVEVETARYKAYKLFCFNAWAL